MIRHTANRLAGLALFAALLAPHASLQADERQVKREVDAPKNTERQDYAGHSEAKGCTARPMPRMPFVISVDGENVDTGEMVGEVGAQRCTDKALERADIRLRFDAGNTKKALNVDGWLDEGLKGKELHFSSYANYASFIERAEIRLFKLDDSTLQSPLRVIDARHYGHFSWQPRRDDADLLKREAVHYVLRVYDRHGRFDETQPKKLVLAARRADEQVNPLTIYGTSAIKLDNIKPVGGMVTIDGNHIAHDQSVTVMNHEVPVDVNGRFAFQQILPPGPHEIEIAVRGGNGYLAEYTRSVSIPDQDWFYVGLADLTVGQNKSSGPVKLVRADASDEFDDKVFVNGRLAFYLKGKIKGDILLTASADTREQPVRDLFSNFSSKDPRYLLRRLAPDKYYPVYGDDSTTTEDAPTQGKFYVRLERGDSHIMWGNFHTSINGTDFMQYRRGLYGGKLRWVSERTTTYGEKRVEVDLFAADPGTLPARDEFRGTAGSLYYLRRQDLTQGSEKVTVEVRDKDTGLVLQSTSLKPGEDYEINYLQGRVMLRTPLASTAGEDGLVRTGSLSGHRQYLVVTYEYAPGLTRIDDLSLGGRASIWADDHLQIGATGYKQDGSLAGQKAAGLDATLRYKPGTYIKGELAGSEGSGTGTNLSMDGGYLFTQQRADGDLARAGRIEGAVDLSELNEQMDGRLFAFWQKKQKGFSSPGHITGGEAADEVGAKADVAIDAEKRARLKLKGAHQSNENLRKQSIEAAIERKLGSDWSVTGGFRADDRKLKSVGLSSSDGEGHRVDLAGRIDYRPEFEEGLAPWMIYTFAQATVAKHRSRKDNHRGGAGGEIQVTKKLKLKGEASGGSGGFGGLAGAEYQLDKDSTLYLNYRLESDRSDSSVYGHSGVLTAGGRVRALDNLSVFAEERYYHGDGPNGLAHGFGLDFSLDKHWTIGLNGEIGQLSEDEIGSIDRKAGGVSLGYARDGFKYRSALEGRHEDTHLGLHQTWLSRNSLSADLNEDWRILTSFNGSWSDGSRGQFYDADFMESVAAFAYRPVAHDRLNMLFKYTFFMDEPSNGQIDDSGLLSDFAQRSHVLALDVSYDVLPQLTIGGKYAMRRGELKDNSYAGDWFTSTAHLAIARLDVHVVKDWDLVLEGRLLEAEEAKDRKTGAMVAVYRHINENLKIGAGYNFSDFSDDLTDLDYNHKGWMLNVVGKF